MDNPLKKEESHSVLSGWKEIANHLDKGVRTVQRYEHDSGLPVRRPSGHTYGSVIAVRSELDGWVCATAMRDAVLSTYDIAHPTIANELIEGIKKMRQLRDEMRVLRHDLRTSLDTLRANLSVTTKLRDGVVADSALVGTFAAVGLRENVSSVKSRLRIV